MTSKERSKFSLAKEAMYSTSFLTCIKAIGGVVKRRSSTYFNVNAGALSFFFSLITNSANLTNHLINGSNKVVVTLKMMWNKAICISPLFGNIASKKETIYGVKIQMKIVKIIVPITLNARWMKAVLLALVVVPIEAIIAVTQVPIFEPKMINKALETSIAPFPTITITRPVAAEDD